MNEKAMVSVKVFFRDPEEAARHRGMWVLVMRPNPSDTGECMIREPFREPNGKVMADKDPRVPVIRALNARLRNLVPIFIPEISIGGDPGGGEEKEPPSLAGRGLTQCASPFLISRLF